MYRMYFIRSNGPITSSLLANNSKYSALDLADLFTSWMVGAVLLQVKWGVYSWRKSAALRHALPADPSLSGAGRWEGGEDSYHWAADFWQPRNRAGTSFQLSKGLCWLIWSLPGGSSYHRWYLWYRLGNRERHTWATTNLWHTRISKFNCVQVCLLHNFTLYSSFLVLTKLVTKNITC